MAKQMPCGMVYVIEPHTWRLAIHTHALVMFGAHLFAPMRKEAEKLWRWGWSAIYPCEEGASYYVAKYVSKNVADWGILDEHKVLKGEGV